MSRPKKLALVLPTSALIIFARRDDVILFDKMPCIYYLVQFQKRGKEINKSLIDSSNKVNAMTPAYAKQLSLQI